MVHDAVTAVARRASALAAVALAAALLSGCAGGAGPATPAVAAVAPDTVRRADCRDWQRSDDAGRRAMVLAIEDFADSEVGSSQVIRYGRVLEDDHATRLLNSWCGQHFARGFKLFKLYERAASFLGTPRPEPSGL